MNDSVNYRSFLSWRALAWGAFGAAIGIASTATIWFLFPNVFLIGCGTRMQKATISLVDEAEARWRTNPVSSYRIIVDVHMNGDTRRNEITVRDGQISEAMVSYRDSGKWVRSQQLTESQALPFTVSGLFETLRKELRIQARTDIRVAFNPDRGYLERVVFGPVSQKNGPLSDSETYIFIRKFEPLLQVS